MAFLISFAASAAADPLVMHYADGRLTAQIDQVPLVEVLATLSAETGARVRGDILEPRDVTKHFDDLPIERAIARLLGRQNFTLRFGADGRLTVIHLRGLPTLPATSGVQRVRRPAPNLHRPVAVPPALQAALGSSRIPLSGLFTAAARQPDPVVRRAAIRLLVDTIEADRDLRDALSAADDGTIARLLRVRAGDDASRVASDIMGAARSYPLRAKAARVMQELRRAAAQPGRVG